MGNERHSRSLLVSYLVPLADPLSKIRDFLRDRCGEELAPSLRVLQTKAEYAQMRTDSGVAPSVQRSVPQMLEIFGGQTSEWRAHVVDMVALPVLECLKQVQRLPTESYAAILMEMGKLAENLGPCREVAQRITSFAVLLFCSIPDARSRPMPSCIKEAMEMISSEEDSLRIALTNYPAGRHIFSNAEAIVSVADADATANTRFKTLVVTWPSTPDANIVLALLAKEDVFSELQESFSGWGYARLEEVAPEVFGFVVRLTQYLDNGDAMLTELHCKCATPPGEPRAEHDQPRWIP